MNEHDGLEPTAAMPRIEIPAAAVPEYLPPPRTPALTVRAPYRFGNPLTYTLRRLLAFAVDFTVVTGAATMMLYALIAINPFTGLPNNSEGGFDATLAMGVGIAVLYLWLSEGILGTTLGKLAFALHVYAPQGRFVGLGRAFTRNLLRPLDALLIGGILALLPGHRRLGDLFGGTVVAHSPLRGFSPVIGWLLIAALCVVPFFVAGGIVTVLAVAAACVEFVPPLVARAVHGLVQLLQSGVHFAGLAAPLPTGIPAPPTSVPSAIPTA